MEPWEMENVDQNLLFSGGFRSTHTHVGSLPQATKKDAASVFLAWLPPEVRKTMECLRKLTFFEQLPWGFPNKRHAQVSRALSCLLG